MRQRSLLVAVLVVLSAAGCGAGPDPATGAVTQARALAYSLTGDEVLTYHTDLEMSATTTFGQELRSIDPSMPSTMDMDMEMGMDVTYQIGDGPEPGSYRVAMTTSNLELVSGAVEMGDERLDLSDLPQGDLDAAFDAQMPEFVYVIDEKGDVVSVEVDGMSFDVGGLMSGTSTGGFSGGQLFGPELPEGEVNIGDTWTTSSEQQYGEAVVLTEETHEILRTEEHNGFTTWVIKTESKTGAYTISWDDIVAMYEDLGGIDQIDGMDEMPPSFQMAMRSSPASTTMTTWLDPETGRAVGMELIAFVSMTMEMGGIPGMGGSFSMDMDASTHLAMELVD